MSGDLISREALLTELNDEGSPYTIGITIDPNDTPKNIVDKTLKAYRTVLIRMVNDLPIAYDVDGVLDKLDEAYNNSTLGNYHEIVRGGGKDEPN